MTDHIGVPEVYSAECCAGCAKEIDRRQTIVDRQQALKAWGDKINESGAWARKGNYWAGISSIAFVVSLPFFIAMLIQDGAWSWTWAGCYATLTVVSLLADRTSKKRFRKANECQAEAVRLNVPE